MRNILFLVTGMTPQVITETVWALACDPELAKPWIPDEIHVLSTEDGLNQIRSRLFSEKEGLKFAKFKQDYPHLENIDFDGSEQYLHVIRDDSGQALRDLRTPKDNETAANVICAKVREFTQDDTINLHVSIAGGRKTMGFYAGYALSLYGRVQDAMSHVLVEERYELARDFFYPTPDGDVYVTNRDGIELKAKDAKIWLANIPFVRLRQQLTDDALISNLSFTEVVGFINAANEMPEITINNNADRHVVVNGKKVKLSPKEFSLYLLVAELNGQNQGLVYPSKEIEGDSINDEAQARYDEIYDLHKTLSGKDKIVMDYDNFSQTVSKIATKLKKGFGTAIGEKIAIQKLDSGEYGLNLPTENIVIGK